jgi:hypothetical protein
MALLGAGCARCGQAYPEQGIRVLAQREGIAFVQLVCPTCQTQTLALVTGGPSTADENAGGDLAASAGEDLAAEGRRRGRRGRPRPPESAPISQVDVLEMRDFLAGYRGDVSGLFYAGRRSREEQRGAGEQDERSDEADADQ